MILVHDGFLLLVFLSEGKRLRSRFRVFFLVSKGAWSGLSFFLAAHGVGSWRSKGEMGRGFAFSVLVDSSLLTFVPFSVMTLKHLHYSFQVHLCAKGSFRSR